MKTFFCKLVPPRPSFAQDLSEAERKLMQEHAAYWREWMEKGHVVAFGVVAGLVVVRQSRMPTRENLSFALRAGVEAPGIIPPRGSGEKRP